MSDRQGSSKVGHLFVQFEFVVDNQSLPLPCCAVEHPECMAVLTDEDDLPYKGGSLLDDVNVSLARGQCISYARSFIAPREQCNLGAREQANMEVKINRKEELREL
jgi:hypothetical protein